jgi:hypothetical protein
MSARKPKSSLLEAAVEKKAVTGFAKIIEEQMKSLGPKSSSRNIWKGTHPVKGPENHGFPREATLSIDEYDELENVDSMVIRPIGLRNLVSVKGGPKMNKAAIQFIGV